MMNLINHVNGVVVHTSGTPCEFRTSIATVHSPTSLFKAPRHKFQPTKQLLLLIPLVLTCMGANYQLKKGNSISVGPMEFSLSILSANDGAKIRLNSSQLQSAAFKGILTYLCYQSN